MDSIGSGNVIPEYLWKEIQNMEHASLTAVCMLQGEEARLYAKKNLGLEHYYQNGSMILQHLSYEGLDGIWGAKPSPSGQEQQGCAIYTYVNGPLTLWLITLAECEKNNTGDTGYEGVHVMGLCVYEIDEEEKVAAAILDRLYLQDELTSVA